MLRFANSFYRIGVHMFRPLLVELKSPDGLWKMLFNKWNIWFECGFSSSGKKLTAFTIQQFYGNNAIVQLQLIMGRCTE
jgi:hypothetical protein